MIQLYVIYNRYALDLNTFKVKWKRYNVQIITKEELEKPHKYQTNFKTKIFTKMKEIYSDKMITPSRIYSNYDHICN